jgi:hypothetical protein
MAERGVTIKLADLAMKEKEVFTMEFDGTKQFSTPYGPSFLFTYSDSKGTKYATFIKGTEYSHEFGKTLLEVVNRFKKGDTFVFRRYKRPSKKDATRSYYINVFTAPDDVKAVNDAAMRRILKKAKDNKLTVDELVALAVNAEATPEEVDWLKSEYLKRGDD